VDVNSGHYRVYLPAWSAGSYALEKGGIYGESTRADPDHSAVLERIYHKLPLIGDANERSERGDGIGDDDCSYIDAGEANYVGSNGINNGNRFSDRHYGGTNYLFPDLHAAWNLRLREELARDYDLNGKHDIDVQP
jgi:prepilin-type processing-associated H-X9-DG protein